ncbi:protein kinase PINOID-like [Impatiens glandulifera]|uniref:protein kinase PINOID-like n=1 Tax=Impatiens glandulifera TaxID=253017 RepID=UPI001FB12A57|nr:protein kinase PINOID-like [Impatiens glandulifera]
MLESDSETLRSSQSSMSSDYSCPSFSRLSFDAVADLDQQHSLEKRQLLKPHRSSDSTWKAIRSAAFRRKSGLSFRDFRLLRQIGAGDIGKVYLCSLRDEEEERCVYAMKVVDREVLAKKKKTERAETEKKILRMLDHPFLPTLHAEFEAAHFSCVVMEFCSGGDLHSLRHKQPQKRFSLNSARFYAAEVLVALEYLHMLGIIYRDLKPENVLVRSDGHIMLSDFDLSLRSDSIPAVQLHHSSPAKHPSPLSCMFTRFTRSKKKVQTTVTTNRQFVAEPVEARSLSFVGTHEYIAPEVAAGKSHGNGVDWWALGIFIYEMMYGQAPFTGETNESTLRNIVKMPLEFPTKLAANADERYARELISGLLAKDPEKRLGSKRGAAEVKTHPFFRGLNFALIRSLSPPEIPGMKRREKGSISLRQRSLKQSSSSSSKRFDFF